MFFCEIAMSLLNVPDQLSHPDTFITGILHPVSPFLIGCLGAALTRTFRKNPRY
jgi:hypothetical protein